MINEAKVYALISFRLGHSGEEKDVVKRIKCQYAISYNGKTRNPSVKRKTQKEVGFFMLNKT